MYITVLTVNNPPFIVYSSADPQPDITTNSSCIISGVIPSNQIGREAITLFSRITTWDQNQPNPGVFAGPFTYTPYGSGNFWGNFTLTNNVLGTVVLPMCNNVSACSPYVVNGTFSGYIQVTDRGGASSVCAISANISNVNTPPNITDFTTAPVSQAISKLLVLIEFLNYPMTNDEPESCSSTLLGFCWLSESFARRSGCA